MVVVMVARLDILGHQGGAAPVGPVEGGTVVAVLEGHPALGGAKVARITITVRFVDKALVAGAAGATGGTAAARTATTAGGTFGC